MKYVLLVLRGLTAAALFFFDVIGAACVAAAKSVPAECSVAAASFRDAWRQFKAPA